MPSPLHCLTRPVHLVTSEDSRPRSAMLPQPVRCRQLAVGACSVQQLCQLCCACCWLYSLHVDHDVEMPTSYCLHPNCVVVPRTAVLMQPAQRGQVATTCSALTSTCVPRTLLSVQVLTHVQLASLSSSSHHTCVKHAPLLPEIPLQLYAAASLLLSQR
jgi:hypothetical protein